MNLGISEAAKRGSPSQEELEVKAEPEWEVNYLAFRKIELVPA